MKILAIGDFHGKFPKKLQKLIGEVDLVLSVGDYPKWSFRKEFFKYCYRTGVNLWDVVGKVRYKKKFMDDWQSAKNIFSKLNSCGKPVLTTVGNYDSHNVNDAFDPDEDENDSKWKWAEQDFFTSTIKKYTNINRIDYRSKKIGDIIFVGAYGQTFPGIPKSKNFKKHYKILTSFFRKFRKENKKGNLIFVTHNMPYNCKLDKIRDKSAPEEAYGEHYGSKLIRKVIDKYQPILVVGGHFHENQGKTRIGKTTVVNTGESGKGEACIIDFDSKKGKVKSLKFVK